MTLREKIACAIYSQDWDCEDFYAWKEWNNYHSPFKENYYTMADKVIAIFVGHYGNWLPPGEDSPEGCPNSNENCCGWHSACKMAQELISKEKAIKS